MIDHDPVKKRNRHINLTYGTAGALVLFVLCAFVLGTLFVLSLRHDLNDFKGTNACRAQVAEDERKATLDVTVGQGELFITAVLAKDDLVQKVTAYREIVQRAEEIASQDINQVCK